MGCVSGKAFEDAVVRWSIPVAVALSLFIATANPGLAAPKPVGTVYISAKQIAFLVSGQGGSGTLKFRGKSYPFKVGGLGVGGIGISRLTATGEVYDLQNASDFYGAYGSTRVGWAVGKSGKGQMWLKNSKGVILYLRTARKGLTLSMGADVIDISRP